MAGCPDSRVVVSSSGSIGEVFVRSLNGQRNPYHWLARAVSSSASLVLDIACGAGAVSSELHRPGRIVVGLDLSAVELALAAERGPGPWVQADALRLPFADDSFDAVTTSMGLAVIRPTIELLGEVARVLKPGGVFAAVLPTAMPANGTDVWLAGRLSWELKTMLRFPGEPQVGFGQACKATGLTKIEDARERYRFFVRSRADAETLFAAIDVEGVPADRVDNAIGLLARLVDEDGEVKVAIPLRRVMAIK